MSKAAFRNGTGVWGPAVLYLASMMLEFGLLVAGPVGLHLMV